MLWGCSDPALDEDERQRLVNALMAARRAVKAAKASGDPDDMKAARSEVQGAKVSLGERGQFGGMMVHRTSIGTR
jgi:hypothetical protein